MTVFSAIADGTLGCQLMGGKGTTKPGQWALEIDSQLTGYRAKICITVRDIGRGKNANTSCMQYADS